MNKIIPFDESYKFEWLEDKLDIKHPLSEYYLKLDDLSINLYINLKWIEWGFFFLNSLSMELDKIKEEYKFSDIIENGIQKREEEKEENKLILIDDREIKNYEELEDLINSLYFDKILERLFNENTKIHMKLKMNLREYLIITNMLYPTLIKWKSIE